MDEIKKRLLEVYDLACATRNNRLISTIKRVLLINYSGKDTSMRLKAIQNSYLPKEKPKQDKKFISVEEFLEKSKDEPVDNVIEDSNTEEAISEVVKPTKALLSLKEIKERFNNNVDDGIAWLLENKSDEVGEISITERNVWKLLQKYYND